MTHSPFSFYCKPWCKSSGLSFISPDIIQTPAAPADIDEFILSEFIPPIAYTGILTERHTSLRKSRPLGGRPFLQSVAKMCPAVRYVAPSCCALTASSTLWTEHPSVEKLSFSLDDIRCRGICIFLHPSRSAVLLKVWSIHSIPRISQRSSIFSASLWYSCSVRSFSRSISFFTPAAAINSACFSSGRGQSLRQVTQTISAPLLSDVNIVVKYGLQAF